MGNPIVVGVTGHRDLREEDLPLISKAVFQQLEKIMKEYPNSQIIMLNSLAAGADVLCAKEALKLAIPLYVPLPMELAEYRKDFNTSELEEFNTLIHQAKEVFVAPVQEALPEKISRDFHYRQAGIYIANHCHLLFALWNGCEPRVNGCGTAETVDFLRNRKGAVVQFKVKRGKEVGPLDLEIILHEDGKGSTRRRLNTIDQHNQEGKRDISI